MPTQTNELMNKGELIRGFRAELSEHAGAIPEKVELALRLAEGWTFEPQGVIGGATCSLVLHGLDSDGRQAVLRVPIAKEEATTGFLAMRAFAGIGGVEIWRQDQASGSTLMPRLLPGSTLAASALTEIEAVIVAAKLFRSLQQATTSDHNWTLERWFRELWDFKPPNEHLLEARVLGLGKELGRHLLDTTTRTTLLHGDLHHFNILQDGDRWVAIDPKGVIGDPAFEPVAFLRNPIDTLADDPDLVNRQRSRIEQFAMELNEPIERIWGWAVAQIALDAAWGDTWAGQWAIVADATVKAKPPEAANL